jgi:hypothetical protein
MKENLSLMLSTNWWKQACQKSVGTHPKETIRNIWNNLTPVCSAPFFFGSTPLTQAAIIKVAYLFLLRCF